MYTGKCVGVHECGKQVTLISDIWVQSLCPIKTISKTHFNSFLGQHRDVQYFMLIYFLVGVTLTLALCRLHRPGRGRREAPRANSSTLWAEKNSWRQTVFRKLSSSGTDWSGRWLDLTNWFVLIIRLCCVHSPASQSRQWWFRNMGWA